MIEGAPTLLWLFSIHFVVSEKALAQSRRVLQVTSGCGLYGLAYRVRLLPTLDETLPLDLIERVGPRGTFISEKHTLKHFRRLWVPTIFDRSVVKDENTRRCRDLLNEKTLEILKTHQPKLLPEDLVKELKKVEEWWLKRVGLKEYPKRP